MRSSPTLTTTDMTLARWTTTLPVTARWKMSVPARMFSDTVLVKWMRLTFQGHLGGSCCFLLPEPSTWRCRCWRGLASAPLRRSRPRSGRHHSWASTCDGSSCCHHLISHHPSAVTHTTLTHPPRPPRPLVHPQIFEWNTKSSQTKASEEQQLRYEEKLPRIGKEKEIRG